MNATSAMLLEMTPRQVLDALEDGMGLSEEALAQALGISRRTLQRWRTGTAYPQHVARQRLAALLQLYQRVRETFEGPDAVRRWFISPSRYLGPSYQNGPSSVRGVTPS